MLCEVFSIHAAISGMPSGTTWRGDLPLEDFADDEVRLCVVYRLLNRVEEGDHERMEAVGYTMPSLSVGDYVTLHLDEPGPLGPIPRPQTWRVASVSFEKVTGNPGNPHMLPLR